MLAFFALTNPLTANASRNTSERYYLKRYYHADGFIKSIGHVARRTIYSSNPVVRLKWKRTLRHLIKVRTDAYTHLHPQPKQPSYSGNYWINRQIQVAEIIAHSSARDPWPHCPDPVFNGAASWQDTVNCENNGNWYDSPGYYRCGLQFDPGWEVKYGKLCP